MSSSEDIEPRLEAAKVEEEKVRKWTDARVEPRRSKSPESGPERESTPEDEEDPTQRLFRDFPEDLSYEWDVKPGPVETPFDMTLYHDSTLTLKTMFEGFDSRWIVYKKAIGPLDYEHYKQKYKVDYHAESLAYLDTSVNRLRVAVDDPWIKVRKLNRLVAKYYRFNMNEYDRIEKEMQDFEQDTGPDDPGDKKRATRLERYRVELFQKVQAMPDFFDALIDSLEISKEIESAKPAKTEDEIFQIQIYLRNQWAGYWISLPVLRGGAITGKISETFYRPVDHSQQWAFLKPPTFLGPKLELERTLSASLMGLVNTFVGRTKEAPTSWKDFHDKVMKAQGT